MSAEQQARRTAAAAALADFRRDEQRPSGEVPWAMWAGRLAAALESVLAPTPEMERDSARLAQIRELLAHFDWEFHDRRLALEAIERIAEGELDEDGGQ